MPVGCVSRDMRIQIVMSSQLLRVQLFRSRYHNFYVCRSLLLLSRAPHKLLLLLLLYPLFLLHSSSAASRKSTGVADQALIRSGISWFIK